jgi:hypothetical protein
MATHRIAHIIEVQRMSRRAIYQRRIQASRTLLGPEHDAIAPRKLHGENLPHECHRWFAATRKRDTQCV